MLNQLDELNVDRNTNNAIWKCNFNKDWMPLIVFDNFFSGQHSMTMIGERGYAGKCELIELILIGSDVATHKLLSPALCTMHRDRCPTNVPKHYLQLQATGTTPVSKFARHTQPVVAIKNVPANGTKPPYQIQLLSMQSTGPTNFQGVNACDQLSCLPRFKERGVGINKRRWVIESNQMRILYLKSYCKLDSVDHMVKNCQMGFVTPKYWLAAAVHFFSFIVVTAFSIYEECCDGELNADWKLNKKDRLDFFEFHE
jgi:hypothetical protein